MKKLGLAIIISAFFILTACSPVKLPVNNQYTLEAFSAKKLSKHKVHQSLLVSKPEAMAGYQTEQMIYVKKPFELNAFSHNAWISSPANMLYPLEMQSLQSTGYFYAVAASPYVDRADYRLDTQFIKIQQNFMVKPSLMDVVIKVVLTHVEDNRIVSSRTFCERVSCPVDSPYGGVLAANKAMGAFTAKLSAYVVAEVKKDSARLHG